MSEPATEPTPEERERAELFAWFDENRSLSPEALAAIRAHAGPSPINAQVEDLTLVRYELRLPLETRTDRPFLDFARRVQSIELAARADAVATAERAEEALARIDPRQWRDPLPAHGDPQWAITLVEQRHARPDEWRAHAKEAIEVLESIATE